VNFRSPYRCSVVPPSIYDAQSFGNECVQLDEEGVQKGSENCLFVNVWTPRIAGNEPGAIGDLDVMVFIHGGGLMTGSGNAYGKCTLYLSSSVYINDKLLCCDILGIFLH